MNEGLEEREKSNEYWLEIGKNYRIHARPTVPVILERGEGIYVWDVEGKRYIDFESGQICMSTGHTHPQLNEAINEQIKKIMQTGSNFTSVPEILLAKKLAEITPEPFQKSFFACSGSEANEIALRMVKKYTGRFEIVAVMKNYHGSTLGSFSVSSTVNREGYGPLMNGVYFIPVPYCYRCPFNECYPDCRLSCIDYTEELLKRVTSGKPAALILELLISGGGVIVPPKEWVQNIRRICNEREMLMIADEAQTGIGRVGKWFMCQHFDVTPDVITTSKTIGGGVPLSAVITSAEIADASVAKGFQYTSSHTGDPFLCAVGLATIELIEQNHLVDHAAWIGDFMMKGLRGLQEKYEVIGDVRGLGTIMGIEIVKDRVSKRPEFDLAARIAMECRGMGLIVGCNPWRMPPFRNVIRIVPPIIAKEEEISTALGILDDAIKAALKHPYG